MIYMQKCQLDVFFSQNKEETIGEFDTLWEIKPPNCICNLKAEKKEQQEENGQMEVPTKNVSLRF